MRLLTTTRLLTPLLLALAIGCRPTAPGSPDQPAGPPAFDPAALPSIDGSRSLRGLIYALASAATRGRPPQEKLEASGDDLAYARLISGDVQVVIATRRPGPAEARRARDAGIELDAQPVALDALVVLLNAANPLDGLRARHVRDIYAGRLASWQELGGRDAPVKRYRRNDDTGADDLFRSLVLRDDDDDDGPIDAADARISLSAGGPFDQAGKELDAISYATYPLAMRMLGSGLVKHATIDGAAPTPANIRARSYPLTREVLIATRKPPPADASPAPEPPAMRFRRWALSEPGQRGVATAGYVPTR